tara:strand:- start:103 stop:483 length:381 start_codon:yes stop_codon:yes gene_type:complete
MNKQINKAKESIKVLSNKETRTNYESVRLANAIFKVESKTLSKVYKELKIADGDLKNAINEVLGKKTLPTFAEFRTKAKDGKELFSVWDGLNMLSKFNVKAQLAKKAKTQQKREAKKTMEVVKKAA